MCLPISLGKWSLLVFARQEQQRQLPFLAPQLCCLCLWVDHPQAEKRGAFEPLQSCSGELVWWLLLGGWMWNKLGCAFGVVAGFLLQCPRQTCMWGLRWVSKPSWGIPLRILKTTKGNRNVFHSKHLFSMKWASLPEHSLGSANTQSGQWLVWTCRLQQQIICDWIILNIPILLQVDNVFIAHNLALIWMGEGLQLLRCVWLKLLNCFLVSRNCK